MPDAPKRQPAPGARPRFERPATAGDASPPRKLRVPDATWVPACERANLEGRRISPVVRDLLDYYAKNGMPS